MQSISGRLGLGALLLVLFLSIFPKSSFAWGDEGHMIIAHIAYPRLTPPVKKKVDSLLAADKDQLTAPDFASRATWADKWRDSDRNGKKVRYNATRWWHFVDIEIANPDYDAACYGHPLLQAGTAASAGPAKDCVADKIEQFRAELKNPSTPRAEKILALKYIMHFVGDLHQPLHASDNNDAGGNSVPVLYGRKTSPDKLHSYWDKQLVMRLGKDYAAVADTLTKSITAAKAQTWSKGTTADWAKETYAQGKAVAYNFAGEQSFVDDHGGKGWHLDAAYDKRALPVVREQLMKGGVRLADVLNDSLR